MNHQFVLFFTRIRRVSHLHFWLVGLALLGGVNAQAATWNQSVNQGWNTPGNWTEDVEEEVLPPNGIDAVANLTNDITANISVFLNTQVTLGTLTAGDSAGPFNNFRISINATNVLTFDVTSGNATIKRNPTGGGQLRIDPNVVLNDPLLITWAGDIGDIRLFGSISGPADDPDNPAIGVTIRSGGSGGDQVRLEGTSATYSYAGDTTLEGGYVGVWTAARLPFGPGKGNVNVNNNGAEVSMLGFWAAGTHDINGLNGDGLVVQAGNDGNLLTLQVGNGDANGVFSGGVQLRSDLVLAPGSRRFSFAKTGAGTQVLSGDNFYNGTTTVSGGTLLVDGKHETVTGGDANAVPGLYTVDSGATLGGKGEIEPSVDLSGVLSPGGSLVLNSYVNTRDTLTIGGLTLQDGATGVFELHPTDTTAGSGINDLLVVDGELVGLVDTTIHLSVKDYIHNSDLGAEGTWTLAQYDSVSGTGIPNFSVTGIAAGYSYTVTPTSEEGPGALLLTLTASGALYGDFNNDGIVNLADYTVWRDNLGGDSSVLNGNGAGNPTVGTDDYDLWKANFGASSGGALATVTANIPEPASMFLLLAAAGMGIARLRSSKSRSTRRV